MSKSYSFESEENCVSDQQLLKCQLIFSYCAFSNNCLTCNKLFNVAIVDGCCLNFDDEKITYDPLISYK